MQSLENLIDLINKIKQIIETTIVKEKQDIRTQIIEFGKILENTNQEIENNYVAKNLEKLTNNIKALEELQEKANTLEVLDNKLASKNKHQIKDLLSKIQNLILSAKAKQIKLDKVAQDNEKLLLNEIEKDIKNQQDFLNKAILEVREANTIDSQIQKYSILNATINGIQKLIKILDKKYQKLKSIVNKENIKKEFDDLTKKLDDARKELTKKKESLSISIDKNTKETSQILEEANKIISEVDAAILAKDKNKAKNVEESLMKIKEKLEKKKASLVGDKNNQERIDGKISEINVRKNSLYKILKEKDNRNIIIQ
ncbi:Uncharacterised protein [Metamycoplasma arthritidis]|uniref:Uncharacterized protein n=1 Tax=Metamycoplasma arthritidis (strain 158L3-1) TaxID=243272 RepID=B3PMI2_META1|nr:hypothetical protein [Metamycoplasma arthritidis]ACF07234.1 hypothetical protein MARTH_orf362 [Metamycoplasma arthritidis 158L3-1]VEU78758.1 Uncharacterised protein [Metamycoplasma arthritidis]